MAIIHEGKRNITCFLLRLFYTPAAGNIVEWKRKKYVELFTFSIIVNDNDDCVYYKLF